MCKLKVSIYRELSVKMLLWSYFYNYYYSSFLAFRVFGKKKLLFKMLLVYSINLLKEKIFLTGNVKKRKYLVFWNKSNIHLK